MWVRHKRVILAFTAGIIEVIAIFLTQPTLSFIFMITGILLFLWAWET